MLSKNAAFSGGGLSSVIGLGCYSEIIVKTSFASFSGASIGSVIAASLAAGKTPEEIREFLAVNIEGFCAFVLGRKRIQKETDKFLNNILFKDLKKECMVSITPLRANFPNLITRENAGNLTVGQVVALSSALPGLFLPGFVKLGKKHAFVVDGGLTENPPLKKGAVNVLFTFKRSGEESKASWNVKKAEQEKKAQLVFKPVTKFETLGKKDDVYAVYQEGCTAMRKVLPLYDFNY